MSGRIRTIKPEWLEDELLVALSSHARVLSIALLLLADDYGNGRAGELYLAARVFPGRPVKILRDSLAEITKMRFAVLFEVDGQNYFHVRNWRKHQNVQHPGKPLVPKYADPVKTDKSLSGDPHTDRRESPASRKRVSGESLETLTPDRRPTTNDHDQRPPERGPARQPAADSTPDPAATAADDSNGESENDESSRETVCPLDLADRPAMRAALAELAEKLPAPIAVLEAEAREFVSYWTVGDGAGRRRTGWARRLRERCRRRFFSGELGSAAQSKPNADWPTDQAIRLREAIRSGRWGTRLKTKEAAGQLDFALALRLIREGEVERHEFAEAKAADPETAERLASLTSGLFRRLT